MTTQSVIFKKANQLIKEGYSRKQAFAIAYSELGEPKRKTARRASKKNPIAAVKRKTKVKTKKSASSYVKRPSQITKNPPSKRLKVRRTKNLHAPVGVFPNPVKSYRVECETASGWKKIASFPVLKDAKEYAVAYARAKNHPVRVMS